MLISTIIFLFFLFVTYAVFLLISRKSDARDQRLEERVAQALRESDLGSFDGEIRITREDSIGGNPTISRLLGFSAVAGLMAGLAASTVVNSVSAFVLAIAAAAVPILHVARQRRKRLRMFNSQLPDTLDLLSRSLSVGHAFSESLNQVGNEMPDPIAAEFRIAFEEQKLGLSIKMALDRLSERVPLLALRLCVTAMHIQRETGGNLAEILEKVSQTIRERYRIMEDFRTMTTASRLSGWILCGLPFALVFVLTIFNPDYMGLLLYDHRGHYVLAFAGVWQM